MNRLLFALLLLFAQPAYAIVEVDTVAEKFSHPWSLAFLPDGRMLVTERAGRILLLSRDGKSRKEIAGVPEVYHAGQAGLLDIALDPDFAKNNTLYFSYAENEGELAGTAVARAVLKDDALTDVKVIFRQQPKVKGDKHFGSRIVPKSDGTLFITLGERFEHRDEAQNLKSDLGKVVRINVNGSIPKDNPFTATSDARHEIWSYGHRNMQGAAINPATGKLWTHEHGAKGGDEINIDEAGKNYGWPVITKGVDYSGAPIAKAESMPGMEQPLYFWTPSIAPSGMMFYTGDKWPGWKGSLFVGALAGQDLHRLTLEGDKVVAEEKLLTGWDLRIRDVRQGPDGYIYFLTDEDDGKLMRLLPAQP